MQDPFSHHDFEEHRGRQNAREFERRSQEEDFYFIDLYVVDEIYHYYLETNELGKAQKLVRFAIQSHPSSADLYYKQARLDGEIGKYHAALTHMETVLSLNPGIAEYVVFQAELLARLERYQEAVKVLEALLPLAEYPEDIFLHLGNVAQVCRQMKASEGYYRRALEMAPDFDEALFELGFLLESEDRLPEAIALYQAFLDEQPYASMVWYNLALLHRKEAQLNQALEALDFAIVIDEDFHPAHYQKGLLLLEQGNYPRALQAFLDARALQPQDLHTLFHIADTYEKLKLYREAIRYYGKATRQDPDYLDAWLGLAYCLEKCEQFLEAVHYYHKAFKLDEDNVEICLSLAICEFKLGNKHSAYLFLQRAIQIDPDELAIWQDWAQLLYDQNSFVGAITFLEDGIQRNPGAAPLYYQIGAYSYEAGLREQGLMYLENALILDFAAHKLLFELMPGLEHDPAIIDLIESYRQ
jgi:tetratricopeptide (TPR) repeat protein